MIKHKCEVEPLGWFGNYRGLSGCLWCKHAEECKKETGQEIKPKPVFKTKTNETKPKVGLLY